MAMSSFTGKMPVALPLVPWPFGHPRARAGRPWHGSPSCGTIPRIGYRQFGVTRWKTGDRPFHPLLTLIAAARFPSAPASMPRFPFVPHQIEQ